MACTGSVSDWIDKVKLGHDSAAAKLWGRYFPKLLSLARFKLLGTPCRVADEEDIVVTAFQSFLRRTRAGDYPFLCNRGGLWKLLATITAHKACNYIRSEKSQKRGSGQVLTAPMIADLRYSLVHETLMNLASNDPSPDVCAMLADSLNRLLSLLGDDELREIALSKLNGMSNEEVAETLQRSVPTIERRLRLIRDAWQREIIE
jgi:DNA-directed RNA polymerase specialized sigma24 family protein